MAIFTPYTNPPPPGSYLGYSREIDVEKNRKSTFGAAVEGIGNVFSNAVTAVDEINKYGIQKSINATVDEQVTASVEAGRSLLEETTPSTPTVNTNINPNDPEQTNLIPAQPERLPAPLELANRRFGILAQANRQGRLDDVALFGQVHDATQRLTLQYPGYERQIWDMASHALQTHPGMRERTAIQTSLTQLQTRADAQRRADQQDIDSWIRAGVLGTEEARIAVTAIGNETQMNNWRAHVAGRFRARHETTDETARFNNEIARGRVTANTAEQFYVNQLDRLRGQAIDGFTFAISGYGQFTFEEMQRRIASEYASGRPDAKLLAAFRTQVANMDATFRTQAELMATDARHGPNRVSIASLMAGGPGEGRRNVSAIIDGHANLFKNMLEMIDRGQTGHAAYLASAADRIRKEGALRALENPYLRGIAIVTTAAPAASASGILTDLVTGTPPSIRGDQVNKLRLDIFGVGAASGTNPTAVPFIPPGAATVIPGSAAVRAVRSSMNTMIDLWNYGNTQTGSGEGSVSQPTGEYLRGGINVIRHWLMQRNSEGAAANAALTITNPETAGFFNKLNVNEQFTAFSMIASPDASARIKELDASNPGLWDRYRTWSQLTFRRLYANLIADTSAFRAEGNNIVFDEDRGLLVFRNRSGLVYNRERDPVVAVLRQVNQGLQAYKAVLEANGERLTPEHMRRLGFELKEPERRSENSSQPTQFTVNLFSTPARASDRANALRVEQGFEDLTRPPEGEEPFVPYDSGVQLEYAAPPPRGRGRPRVNPR